MKIVYVGLDVDDSAFHDAALELTIEEKSSVSSTTLPHLGELYQGVVHHRWSKSEVRFVLLKVGAFELGNF